MINRIQERQLNNILSKQAEQDEVQLTLMLALADQYEKQLALEENQNKIMQMLEKIYDINKVATDEGE